MGQPWDGTDEFMNLDESIVALLDAIAELDEEDELYPVTEDALAEAQVRACQEFERGGAGSLSTDAIGADSQVTGADSLVAEMTILEVEEWLKQAPVDAVRLRGPVAVSATEWNVPELAATGYAAGIEIDVDVDANDRTVDLAMQFNPVAASPMPLTVVVIDGEGTSRAARVNTFGLAELPGVRVDRGMPLVVRLMRAP